MHTARFTVTIKPNLLSRLRLFSKSQKKTVSQVVEKAIADTLDKQGKQRTEAMYKRLFALREALNNVEADPRYNNLSVDAILYGDNGAWSTTNREGDA